MNSNQRAGGIGVAFGRTTKSLSVVAAGAFAVAVPFANLDTIFNNSSGSAFDILPHGASFRKSDISGSKTKGILMPGSCVLVVQTAGDVAQIKIHPDTTGLKAIWVDREALREAPRGTTHSNCTATIMPRPDTLDARVK